MKRPKTYKFSELWDERAEEHATREQLRPTVRRRRGRPPGQKARKQEQALLKRLRAALAAGWTVAECAAALDVPVELVERWAMEEV